MKNSLPSRGYLWIIFLLGTIFLLLSECFAVIPLVEIGKVENFYRRGKDTIVSIKVNTKLPTSTMVYISKEIPVVVEQMYHEEDSSPPPADIDKYSKDIGKVSTASGILVLRMYEKVKTLEQEVTELKTRITDLGKRK